MILICLPSSYAEVKQPGEFVAEYCGKNKVKISQIDQVCLGKIRGGYGLLDLDVAVVYLKEGDERIAVYRKEISIEINEKTSTSYTKAGVLDRQGLLDEKLANEAITGKAVLMGNIIEIIEIEGEFGTQRVIADLEPRAQTF